MGDLYRQLVDDYHLLFPAKEAQLSLLKETAGAPPARILDCASGTGEYVAALATADYEIQGIEIDELMYDSAVTRHPQLAASLILGDMIHAEQLTTGPFELVYCIGNSLAHLDSVAEVASAIQGMWELARPTGKVLLQVANFDYALRRGYQAPADGEAPPAGQDDAPGFSFEMPVLSATRADGSQVQLIRHYLLRRSADLSDRRQLPDKLVFHTVLRTLEGEHEAFTPLLILTYERLSYCLPREANHLWLGGFDRRPWSAECPATIVVLQ